ncbi:MAG: MarR family transcriptional regulator [Pseudorhodoplanes sp.]
MARQTAISRGTADAPLDRTGEALDFGPFGDWIGFQLRMAQIASFQSFARHAQGIGLSPGRFAALLLIDRNPGISQTALSRAIGSDKSTLTPVLDDLVKRGLISRERTPADRRLYELKLTEPGRKVMRAMHERAQRHEHALDAIVGPRERAQFMKILRRIAAATNQ